jgi:hypothetical protein
VPRLRPDLVAEIERGGWSGAVDIRQASFKGLRQGELAAKVVAETHALANTTAIATPPENAECQAPDCCGTNQQFVGNRDGRAEPISRPEKESWRDDGKGEPVTKADLALPMGLDIKLYAHSILLAPNHMARLHQMIALDYQVESVRYSDGTCHLQARAGAG